MKEIQIDRERAIKVAAVAGLVVLGLSVLPGLLKTPKAPELPPDVGFTAAESSPETLLPDPGKSAEPDPAGKANPRAGSLQGRSAKAGDSGNKHRRESAPERPRKHRKSGGLARREVKKDQSNSPPSTGTTVASPSPAPAPAAPATVTPPPKPAAPASSPPPNDGSQEFAPR